MHQAGDLYEVVETNIPRIRCVQSSNPGSIRVRLELKGLRYCTPLSSSPLSRLRYCLWPNAEERIARRGGVCTRSRTQIYRVLIWPRALVECGEMVWMAVEQVFEMVRFFAFCLWRRRSSLSQAGAPCASRVVVVAG